jgi:hypothetical protein
MCAGVCYGSCVEIYTYTKVTKMSEPREEATERVELLPVYPHEIVEGALTFQALALFPFADDPVIPSPSTTATLTVPYGSLIKYAQHLINVTGSSNIRFLLRFHHYFGSTDEPILPMAPVSAEVVTEEQLAEMKAQGKILDLNDPNVQKAIQEGKIVIASERRRSE